MKRAFNPAKLGFYVFVAVAFGISVVKATPIDNFVDSFAPSQWTMEPDQGQTYFANSDTELEIVGPTGNFYPSYDAVSVVGPAGAPQYLLNFQWTFNSGDSEGATASISWAGEPNGNPLVLASGGPGTSDTGDLSLVLAQGDTLSILLNSGETGAGKQPAYLTLTNFSYAVPDSTPWIEASLFLPLLFYKFAPAYRRRN